MLGEIGAKVIGVVLNKIDMHSQKYYYYYHHYKGYYSESESNGERPETVTSVSIIPK